MSLQIPSVKVLGMDNRKPFTPEDVNTTFSLIWGVLLASIGGRFRLVQTALGNRDRDSSGYARMVFAGDANALIPTQGLVIRVRKMGPVGGAATFVEVDFDPRHFPCENAWQVSSQAFSYEDPTPNCQTTHIRCLAQLEALIDEFVATLHV